MPVALHDIHHEHGHAVLGIVIGEALPVDSRNSRAIRACERVGFVREGVLRDHVFADGRFHDHFVMSADGPGPRCPGATSFLRDACSRPGEPPGIITQAEERRSRSDRGKSGVAWRSAIRPIQIGPVRIEHPVVLAPMAGVCNLAFRLLCREHGAALVCSEFVSARALEHENERTLRMIQLHPDEHPVSIQLFGADPGAAAHAARLVEEQGADLVDFNLGCPVPKVIKAEAGAALMRKPDHAQRILEAMVNAVSIPVTVKMRTGWDDACINVVDLARRFEAVGVAAVAVHGRTAHQHRSGRANWDIIGEVKAAVSIPVIGNGDVFTPQDALAMLRRTGCDGVMIGRGALGNPWIFRRTVHYLETGELLPEPTPAERARMVLEHYDRLAALKGEWAAGREMRRHAPAYVKGLPGAAAMRERLVRSSTRQDYAAALERLLEPVPA